MTQLFLQWIGLMLMCACLAGPVRADDWPQWMGPRRDGVWRESGLLTQFPKDGLKIRWRVPVGGGYAGPAVATGRVYIADFTGGPDVQRPSNPFKRITQPGVERVQCLDEATGKVLWTHATDVAYSMSYSAGPRSTPTVDGDRVYTFGGEGDLLCLATADGKLIWSKKASDAQAATPMWGFSSQPLVDGDRLIVHTGGADPVHGRGVVTAFNKLTGDLIWTALTAKEPGYAPPVIYEAAGVRQLIDWTPDGVHSLNPETGKEYWFISHPAKMGLCIVTPRFVHDPQLGTLLFVGTQYEGSLVIKLDDVAPKAAILWERKGKNDRHTDALHTLLSTASVHDGHIYGVDAYGELRCLDLKNGDRLWENVEATTYQAGPQKWSSAFLIQLGDGSSRYLIANEHGDLILADLDPTGYHELSRTHLLEPTNTDPGRPVVWCHPACADRCIFWRNDKEIVCASMAAQ